MHTKTLIIHGWNDCSDSFHKIKEYLNKEAIGDLSSIYFTDYDSREDSLTFNDVADGLQNQLIKQKLIGPCGEVLYNFNVLVHSTGGLVVRHWIWRYYYKEGKIKDCPVKRIVMLAPANFGSPLAHRGKSFMGSLLKGKFEMVDFLEVGRNILTGLELASPYQWEMAHRDLLIKDPYFNSEQIQLTILTGIKTYSGLMGLVNKDGTDGTVVISGTSVNCAKITIDCTQRPASNNYTPLKWHLNQNVEDYSFAVLEDYNHSTIVDNIHKDENLADLVKRAFKISDAASFRSFRDELAETTKKTYQKNDASEYQQFIVHAIDDHSEPIEDFTIEFFLRKAGGEIRYGVLESDEVSNEEFELSDKLNRLLTKEFHSHTKNSSFRRFLVNIKALNMLIEEAVTMVGPIILSMKVHVPPVDKRIRYAFEDLQNIVFYDSRDAAFYTKTFFYPNTTTLIELVVNRENDCVVVDLISRKKA